jgi:hypothetical protein
LRQVSAVQEVVLKTRLERKDKKKKQLSRGKIIEGWRL